MIFSSLFLTLQNQDETWPRALIPQPGLLRESLHWPWVLGRSMLWASKAVQKPSLDYSKEKDSLLLLYSLADSQACTASIIC